METTRHGKERRTSAQWAEVLAEYRGNGLTQDAFARSCGVSVAALRNHLYRRKKQNRYAGPARSRGFVPVRLRTDRMEKEVTSTSAPTLVVRWPQGMSVELHVDPTAPDVVELIGSLIARCSH